MCLNVHFIFPGFYILRWVLPCYPWMKCINVNHNLPGELFFMTCPGQQISEQHYELYCISKVNVVLVEGACQLSPLLPIDKVQHRQVSVRGSLYYPTNKPQSRPEEEQHQCSDGWSGLITMPSLISLLKLPTREPIRASCNVDICLLGTRLSVQLTLDRPLKSYQTMTLFSHYWSARQMEGI